MVNGIYSQSALGQVACVPGRLGVDAEPIKHSMCVEGELT